LGKSLEKQNNIKNKRYKYFCHNCKAKFDSNEILHECECGGEALTITDYDKPSSGYFVKGVRV